MEKISFLIQNSRLQLPQKNQRKIETPIRKTQTSNKDSTELEENLIPSPHFFQVKFIKQLNKYQSYRFGEKKRKKIKKVTEIKEQDLNILLSSAKDEENLITTELVRNGNIVKGTWKNNQLHGYTTINYNDGAYFQGDYTNGVRSSGKMTFPNGNCYTGGFLGDQFHGEGILSFANGKTFEGQWNQGILQGNVTITYQNGDIYYGKIQNFKKNGYGHLFFKNGNKYIGEFKEGKITGFGTYYQNQVPKIEGVWENGVFAHKVEINQSYD